MASYDSLSLPQAEGTQIVPRSGIRMRYASNGAVRVRALSSATRYDLRVVHRGLTQAQWLALKAFYEARRTDPTFSITFVPENVAYTVVFADRPFDMTPEPGAGAAALFNVTVNLVQAT